MTTRDSFASILQSPLVSPLVPSLVYSELGGSEPPAWSPLDIASCFLLLDASDLSTLFTDSAGTIPVTTTGDDVGAWLNKATGAHLFTEATAANKPHWNDAALPYVDFVAATPSRLAATINLSAVGALTWVFGVRRELASSDQTLLNQNVLADPSFMVALTAGNNLQVSSNGGTVRQATQAVDTGVPLLEVLTTFQRLQSTPLVQSRINGVAGTPLTTSQGVGTAYGNASVRLCQRTDGIRAFDGRVFAVAGFSSILSGTDLSDVEAWVAAKTGATLA